MMYALIDAVTGGVLGVQRDQHLIPGVAFVPLGDAAAERGDIRAAVAGKRGAMGADNVWRLVDAAAPEDPPESEVRAEYVGRVKGEAYRRIVAICPEWRQRNLTARASILADKGRAAWSADEAAAWAAGAAIWDRIDAIRARSNVIEAMEPPAPDVAADDLWP